MDQFTNSDLQTRLAVMTEALRRAEERAVAGQLALEMIHEIRNPLEALGHLTYLTKEQADDSQQVRQYMRLAEEQMATLRHIASQTLGFARSSETSKPMCLVKLAEAAIRIHKQAIETKKIHLVKRFPEQLIAPIYGVEMLQVLSNLIVNAMEALPEQGTLHLRLKKQDDEVHLIIADNGHGIRAEHIGSIFEPFFTTKGEKGTGLGLALTKKIIDHHKGRIGVRSCVDPTRGGTAFKIALPV